MYFRAINFLSHVLGSFFLSRLQDFVVATKGFPVPIPPILEQYRQAFVADFLFVYKETRSSLPCTSLVEFVVVERTKV